MTINLGTLSINHSTGNLEFSGTKESNRAIIDLEISKNNILVKQAVKSLVDVFKHAFSGTLRNQYSDASNYNNKTAMTSTSTNYTGDIKRQSINNIQDWSQNNQDRNLYDSIQQRGFEYSLGKMGIKYVPLMSTFIDLLNATKAPRFNAALRETKDEIDLPGSQLGAFFDLQYLQNEKVFEGISNIRISRQGINDLISKIDYDKKVMVQEMSFMRQLAGNLERKGLSDEADKAAEMAVSLDKSHEYLFRGGENLKIITNQYDLFKDTQSVKYDPTNKKYHEEAERLYSEYINSGIETEKDDYLVENRAAIHTIIGKLQMEGKEHEGLSYMHKELVGIEKTIHNIIPAIDDVHTQFSFDYEISSAESASKSIKDMADVTTDTYHENSVAMQKYVKVVNNSSKASFDQKQNLENLNDTWLNVGVAIEETGQKSTSSAKSISDNSSSISSAYKELTVDSYSLVKTLENEGDQIAKGRDFYAQYGTEIENLQQRYEDAGKDIPANLQPWIDKMEEGRTEAYEFVDAWAGIGDSFEKDVVPELQMLKDEFEAGGISAEEYRDRAAGIFSKFLDNLKSEYPEIADTLQKIQDKLQDVEGQGKSLSEKLFDFSQDLANLSTILGDLAYLGDIFGATWSQAPLQIQVSGENSLFVKINEDFMMTADKAA